MMKKAVLALALAAVSCGGSGGIGAVSCGGGGSTSTTAQSAAPAPGSPMPESIVDPYLKIQSALATDRIDEVKANAGTIATAATSLGPAATKIDTAAVKLASAGELTDAREKFGALSDAVVAYMDERHLTAPPGVRKAYCPMVRKPWLQKGDTIANPYYGTSMPTCGEFR
jgi:hypothetical protein